MLKFREWLVAESLGDERPLLMACLLNIRDDMPKMAYADWLDEHPEGHNPLVAAFIRAAVTRIHAGPRPRKGQDGRQVQNGRLKDLARKIYGRPEVFGHVQAAYFDPDHQGIYFRDSQGRHNQFFGRSASWTGRHAQLHGGGFHGPLKDFRVGPGTIVRDRPKPWRMDGNNAVSTVYGPNGNFELGPTVPPDHPDHPDNWSAPWMGDVVEPSVETLRQVLIEYLLQQLPAAARG